LCYECCQQLVCAQLPPAATRHGTEELLGMAQRSCALLFALRAVGHGCRHSQEGTLQTGTVLANFLCRPPGQKFSAESTAP